jgi:hypothetical protein
MLMPAAMIMANQATTREVESARPDAPVRDDRPARHFFRTRSALSRGLHAIARAIAPAEPRRAAAAPRDILDPTRSVIAGWHG